MRVHHPLLHCWDMTTRDKVAALIEQIAELPDEAQAELIERLLEQRADEFGTYHDDETVWPSAAQPTPNGASAIL